MKRKPEFEPTGPEDSWETLAGDLFGIDFNKEHSIAETDLPADEIDASTGVKETSPESAQVHAEQLSLNEPAETSAAPDDNVAGGNQEQPVEEVEEEVVAKISEAEDAEPMAQRPEDPYWDPLESWNWDEEPADRERTASRREPRRESRSRTQKSPSRSERTAEKSNRVEPRLAEEVQDSFVTDQDFGAGVLDFDSDSPPEPVSGYELEESEPASTADETVLSPAETEEKGEAESEETAPHKKRRRRRRRRKPRSPASSEPQDNGTDSEPNETADVDAEERDETSESDDSDKERDGEKPARKRRRRRSPRRNRKKSSEVDEIEKVEGTVEGTIDNEEEEDEEDDDDTLSFSDDDDDDDDETSPDAGGDNSQAKKTRRADRKVPTWEEAISILMTSNLSQTKRGDAESRSRSATDTKGEKSKSSGRRGRRRRKS